MTRRRNLALVVGLRVSNGTQSPLQFGESDQPVTLEEFTKVVKGE